MKKTFFLSWLAIAAVIFGLVACQKNTDPEPEPEPEPETSTECTHADLEYVFAIKRTATTKGNIEHWHCNCCNRNFLDAEAKQEVKNVYLRALNYAISPALLDRIQHIYPFVPASEQTQTKAAKRDKDDKGLIPSAVTFLHHKIQEFKFKEYSKALFKELEEIDQQLTMIESQVEEIQKQNTAILAKVEDTPYSDAVDEIFNVGRFVWEVSCDAFDNVMKVYSDFNDGKITKLELKSQLKGIGFDWNQHTYRGDHVYDIVTRAVEQFSGYYIDRGEKMTYPQIFHHFNSDYRLWDNQGYTDRKQMDVEAEAVLSMGYFMASIYRDNTKIYGWDGNRQKDSSTLSGYYDLIEPLVEEDIENMQKANDAYRYFHDETTKMYICNKFIIANPDIVVDKIDGVWQIHKSDKSQNSFITNFESTLNDRYDFGLSNGTSFLVEDFSAIRKDYTNGDIMKILRDSAGIANLPLFHETRSVDGTNRTLVYKYTSSQLNSFSGSSSKCSSHWGACKKIDVLYDEYHAYGYWTCACKGDQKSSMEMYCFEMNTDCAKGDGKQVLKNINSSIDNDHHTKAWVLKPVKKSNWTPNANAFVFLKKYTGTIYDK